MGKSFALIVALAVFVLWMKIVGTPQVAETVIGLILAAAAGVWVFVKARRSGSTGR